MRARSQQRPYGIHQLPRRSPTQRIHAPERSIQRARELRRVAHERAAVRIPRVHQPPLDRIYAAVHHVARGDAVRARGGVRERDVRDARGGLLGEERAGGVRAEEPAVPVRGVLAEADVRGDVERGEERAEAADRGDDGALGVVCGGAARVLGCRGELGER